MKPSVRNAWLAFTEPLEGGVPWLYADVLGLVTIGYGNLVDPVRAALVLPLKHPDGRAATSEEITAEWLSVKGDPMAAKQGHLYSRSRTTLRLTLEDMAAFALAKLDAHEAAVARRFRDWHEYPACAQMAIHSLAWACGPAFRFPRLESAVRARDWDACSVHIQMREIAPDGTPNPGLRPRNKRNRILMQNARVLEPDVVDWTRLAVARESQRTPPELETGSGPILRIDPGSYLRPDKPPDDAE